MAKPFDYSKWDKIELSDDEDDVHPNIDKDSWFRWKHQARVEREEKEEKEKQELDEKLKLARARRKEVAGKLQAAQAGKEEGDVPALQAELKDVEKEVKGYETKLIEMEKNRKLNVDNIGTVVKDYTFINKRETPDVLPEDFRPTPASTSTSTSSSTSSSSSSASRPTVTAGGSGAPPPPKAAAPPSPPTSAAPSPSAPAPAAPGPRSELEQVETYNSFATAYQDLLEQFSEVHSMDETREMLHHKGHILLAEHAQSYLLLSCLEDEMNGKHERMKNTARQSQILSHITELAHSLKRSPRDVVIPFFKKLETPEQLTGFLDAVNDFIKRIEKRAVEKRKEMAEARARGEDVDGYEEEEVPLEERLGPGGLDPVEVFKHLPIEMQKAFEERDIEKLHKALADMPIEEAKRHMKACEDSGLWVPTRGSEEGEKAAT